MRWYFRRMPKESFDGELSKFDHGIANNAFLVGDKLNFVVVNNTCFVLFGLPLFLRLAVSSDDVREFDVFLEPLLVSSHPHIRLLPFVLKVWLQIIDVEYRFVVKQALRCSRNSWVRV